MKQIIKLFIAISIPILASCSSSSNNESKKEGAVADSISSESRIWTYVNYDDGFGDPTSYKFLQAQGVGSYSDPTVEKMEMAVYINVDPNYGRVSLQFSNGSNFLKGQGEMSLKIKDSAGVIHDGTLFNNQDGLTVTTGSDKDIIYELLKTEKPLNFRIEQQTIAGPITMVFSFPNDNHYNKMLKDIPYRDVYSSK